MMQLEQNALSNTKKCHKKEQETKYECFFCKIKKNHSKTKANNKFMNAKSLPRQMLLEELKELEKGHQNGGVWYAGRWHEMESHKIV